MSPTPYYQDEWVTLYHGDCREVMEALGPEAVDCVITDPPYSERTHKGARSNDATGMARRSLSGRAETFTSISESDLRAVLSQAAQVSRGWVVSTLDYRHAVGFDNDPPEGLRVLRLGVWVKTNPTPQISGDRPAQGWESIAYMHRSDRRSAWNGGGRHGNFVSPIPPPEGHPTAKPLGMVCEWIRMFTKPGQTVLDPFVGSGTTLRAAKDEGRFAIGAEIDERYCEIAARRLTQDVLDFGAIS